MSKVSRRIIGEARPSFAFDLLSSLTKGRDDITVVDTRAQADGFAALLRTADGQAYEIQIRPAAYAKHPGINQAKGSGRGTNRERPSPSTD